MQDSEAPVDVLKTHGTLSAVTSPTSTASTIVSLDRDKRGNRMCFHSSPLAESYKEADKVRREVGLEEAMAQEVLIIQRSAVEPSNRPRKKSLSQDIRRLGKRYQKRQSRSDEVKDLIKDAVIEQVCRKCYFPHKSVCRECPDFCVLQNYTKNLLRIGRELPGQLSSRPSESVPRLKPPGDIRVRSDSHPGPRLMPHRISGLDDWDDSEVPNEFPLPNRVANASRKREISSLSEITSLSSILTYSSDSAHSIDTSGSGYSRDIEGTDEITNSPDRKKRKFNKKVKHRYTVSLPMRFDEILPTYMDESPSSPFSLTCFQPSPQITTATSRSLSDTAVLSKILGKTLCKVATDRFHFLHRYRRASQFAKEYSRNFPEQYYTSSLQAACIDHGKTMEMEKGIQALVRSINAIQPQTAQVFGSDKPDITSALTGESDTVTHSLESMTREGSGSFEFEKRKMSLEQSSLGSSYEVKPRHNRGGSSLANLGSMNIDEAPPEGLIPIEMGNILINGHRVPLDLGEPALAQVRATKDAHDLAFSSSSSIEELVSSQQKALKEKEIFSKSQYISEPVVPIEINLSPWDITEELRKSFHECEREHKSGASSVKTLPQSFIVVRRQKKNTSKRR